MGPVRLDIPTFASKSLGRLVTERGEIKLECLGVLTTKLTTYETDNGGQHGTTAERTRGSDVRQCISADVYGPRFKRSEIMSVPKSEAPKWRGARN